MRLEGGGDTRDLDRPSAEWRDPALEDDGWGQDEAVGGRDAIDPFAHPDLRPAEREMLEAVPLDSAQRLPQAGHVSEVYVVDEGPVLAYMKPASGESQERQDVPRGEQFRREVGTSIVDEALGFELVPATVVRDHDRGEASLQMHAPGDARPLGEYDAVDRQRMAVLDYITGQMDRHAGNYRSQDDGRPAAIDNGLSFPEGNAEPLRSVFFDAIIDQPLDPAIQRQVEALDVDDLERRLRAAGLSEAALRGMEARIEEVRTGWVTGRAYGWDLRAG
jgi:hypothetical protein